MTNHRILVIDDDPKMLELLRVVLEKDGFEVLEAADGNDGLSMFWEQHPDLVVADIAMPNLDGYQVIQQIRATSGEAARTPVVILTAYPPKITLIDADEVDADLYLTKPITSHELVSFVHRLLGD